MDGIKIISQELETINYNKLHFVFGTVNDKKLDSIIKALPKDAIYYFCKANIPRGLDTDQLLKHAKTAGLNGKAYSSVITALNSAKKNAQKNDLILVGGSAFVVADIL